MTAHCHFTSSHIGSWNPMVAVSKLHMEMMVSLLSFDSGNGKCVYLTLDGKKDDPREIMRLQLLPE